MAGRDCTIDTLPVARGASPLLGLTVQSTTKVCEAKSDRRGAGSQKRTRQASPRCGSSRGHGSCPHHVK